MLGTVAVVVVDGNTRAVDGDLLEVGVAAVAVEVRVLVGEKATLEERVVGEVDAADNVGGAELGELATGEDWQGKVGSP